MRRAILADMLHKHGCTLFQLGSGNIPNFKLTKATVAPDNQKEIYNKGPKVKKEVI